MKKQRIALVLWMLLAGSVLAGCANNGTVEETTNSQGAGTTEAASEKSAEDREEVTVRLAYYRATQPTDAAVTAIEDALTELALEKFNTRIELEVVSKADYPNYLNLALAGGEDLDWIQFGASGMTLPTMYNSDQI